MTLDDTKFAGDIVSFGVVFGTLAQFLPAIAALASLIWTLLRIYEGPTVQRAIARRRRLPESQETSDGQS